MGSSSATITFTADLANYTGTLTRTITFNDIPLTYNGSTEKQASYHGSLTISPVNSSYQLSWDNSSYASQLTKSSTDTGSRIYIKSSTGKVLYTESPTVTGDHLLEDILKTEPVLREETDYTGSSIDLLASEPVFNTAYADYNSIKDSLTWYFTKSGSSLGDNAHPSETAVGKYEYEFHVKIGSTNQDFTVKTYTCTVYKDLNHSNITFSPEGADYQSGSNGIDGFFTVKDGGNTLARDTDYTLTVSPTLGADNAYETGTDITFTFEGITNDSAGKYYRGQVTKTVPVSAIDILINGEPQVNQYDDEVRISAADYSISDSSSGSFLNDFTYPQACKNKTLTLYFKLTDGGNLVKQDITGLNIGEAANINLEYDGDYELRPYYYDAVRITAEGYTVSTSRGGTYADEYILNYDENRQGGNTPVPDFSLYFKNKETGEIDKKLISGINLYKSPDITILYNGEDLKEWYNTDVLISADGYTVSDFQNTGFTKTYKMTGSGTVSKKLWFKQGTNAAKDYQIVVAIDKGAPGGTIAINGVSSNSFIKSDEIKTYINQKTSASISSFDEVSGVDKTEYYVGDKYYPSASELEAAMKEGSKSWRT